MYYALLYDTVPDYLERRKPFRAEHLALGQRSLAAGHLLLGGAFDPADMALLVFRADGPGPVEDFVRQDPYVKHGLVTRWRICPWKVAIGGES
jgi:uncharacterized protein YciI